MKKISFTLLFLLLCSNSWAVLVSGTDTESTADTNAASPHTFTHTTVAATDCLVVAVTIFDTSATDGVVSGVTFDGDAMDEITLSYDATSDGHQSIWHLNRDALNTVTGTVSIVHGGTVTDIKAGAINLSGADTGCVVDAVAVADVGNESTEDMDMIWDVAAGSVGVAAVLNDQSVGSRISLDGSATSWYILDVGNDTVAVADEEYASATTVTIGWTNSDDDEDWAGVAASFVEGASVEAGRRRIISVH